eukprot:m.337173 g.337173  ORF g.337173 m.337173 type:complete len:391 (+) comp20545_c0_seq1:135-1307(+)
MSATGFFAAVFGAVGTIVVIGQSPFDCPVVSSPIVESCNSTSATATTCRYYVENLQAFTTPLHRTCNAFCNQQGLTCGAMHDTQGLYTAFPRHIGCHHSSCSGNCGFIGRPRDFLSDVSSTCTDGSQACVELGMRACNYLVATGRECWGFAVHRGWGVQMYNNQAVSEGLCSGDEGLQGNGAWNTWRRNLDVCAAESSHACDYIGDADDTDWVCECNKTTAAPTQAPSVATITTVTTQTTHTGPAMDLRDVQTSINTILSQQDAQDADIRSLQAATAEIARLNATVQALLAQSNTHGDQLSTIRAGISQGLGRLPFLSPPADPTDPAQPCPIGSSGDQCQPAVLGNANGTLSLQALGGSVFLNTRTCGSFDPCDVREAIRQVILALNDLG